VFFITIVNFPRFKLTKYVKKINITPDLKTAVFDIYGKSKPLQVKIENIIMSQDLNPVLEKDSSESNLRTFLMVGVEGKNYLVPLTSAEIPNMDLFSLVIKGYNLNSI